MKTKCIYHIHSLIAIICMASVIMLFSCSKETEIDKAESKFISELVGKWTIKSGHTYAINSSGVEITTATLKPNTFAHEFFADGSYTGYEYVQNQTESGTFMLENIVENADEFEATLAITTPSIKAAAGELFVDADGYQRFFIGITKSEENVMNAKSKKYEAYPHKENWAEFLFLRF